MITKENEFNIPLKIKHESINTPVKFRIKSANITRKPRNPSTKSFKNKNFSQQISNITPNKSIVNHRPNSTKITYLKTNPNSKNVKSNNSKWKFSNEPIWKKFLRGKLLKLTNKNLILCETKFNPLSFTESITSKKVGDYKNKFRYLNKRNEVGIYTNRFPTILNNDNAFYSRFFDNFISPDELLNKNFTQKEIYQILSDPGYFKYGNKYKNTSFFVKKTLTQTLNEEEKIGPSNLINKRMKTSLKLTKRKVNNYLDYYTTIMSKKSMINKK